MRRTLLIALILLIIVAHVGLWRDPEVPLEVKRRLTLINALGWAVILLPAYGVSRWLRAKVSAPPEQNSPQSRSHGTARSRRR